MPCADQHQPQAGGGVDLGQLGEHDAQALAGRESPHVQRDGLVGGPADRSLPGGIPGVGTEQRGVDPQRNDRGLGDPERPEGPGARRSRRDGEVAAAERGREIARHQSIGERSHHARRPAERVPRVDGARVLM